MSKPIKYGLFLFVLLAFVAVLLTLVNSLTSPVIADNQMKVVQEQLEIIDSESDFKEISPAKLPKGISNIYGGYKGDELVTVVYLTSTVGYSSGEIKVLTAFNVEDETIIKTIVTLADKQTADIGDKILTHDFKTTGKKASDYASIVVEELNKTQFEIISGATVSSKGFLSGVQIAASHFVGEDW